MSGGGRDGSLNWELIDASKLWTLHKTVDEDYRPPKHLWWTIYGPQNEIVTLPTRLSEAQVRKILEGFNDAEEMG